MKSRRLRVRIRVAKGTVRRKGRKDMAGMAAERAEEGRLSGRQFNMALYMLYAR